MKERYTAPSFEADAFNCPHCGAYAHQHWFAGATISKISSVERLNHSNPLSVSICERCQGYALWHIKKMLYPIASVAPLPAEDMPQNVKADFLEARNVVNYSPRAAAALSRLALQKLMVHLGESGQNTNDDIGNLVKKGLPVTIQKALDAVRVIGNNAVHPGKLDLKDDTGTAIALFGLVNIIVEVMITQPKEVEELYSKIPDGDKKAIQKRDKTA